MGQRTGGGAGWMEVAESVLRVAARGGGRGVFPCPLRLILTVHCSASALEISRVVFVV